MPTSGSGSATAPSQSGSSRPSILLSARLSSTRTCAPRAEARDMRVAVSALAAFLLLLAAAPARAFDKEAHFHLTFAVARLAGFSPADALTIASANQAVDENTDSDAMPNVADAAAVSKALLSAHAQTVGAAIADRGERVVRAQTRLHAFRQGDEQSVENNKKELYAQTVAAKDHPLEHLGVYLHFVADYWSHQHDGTHLEAGIGQGACAFHAEAETAERTRTKVEVLEDLHAGFVATADLNRLAITSYEAMSNAVHYVDKVENERPENVQMVVDLYDEMRRYAVATGRAEKPMFSDEEAKKIARGMIPNSAQDYDSGAASRIGVDPFAEYLNK